MTLWIVPKLLLDYYRFPNHYRDLVTTVGYVALVAGFLLLGSIGMSLLTGKYQKHRKAFHRIWLIVGVPVIGAIFWVSIEILFLQNL